MAQLKTLSQQLAEALLPGNKALNKTELKVLLQGIQSAVQSVTDSIPYIEKSFGEEMEAQTNKAVGELEAVAAHLIHNTGLKAIAAAQASLPEFPKPQLGTGSDEKK